MSTMTENAAETSVTFSLAELAKLEAERVRDEEARRARARQETARQQREAEVRRIAAEAAEAEAAAEAQRRRRHREAEEQARLEARTQAAVLVARLEAEARARLDADNAQRAHELAVLRTRNEGGHRRVRRALVAALGLVLCAGAAAAYGVSREVASVTQDAARLREGQAALAREREQAKATELTALDRRHAGLRTRARVLGAGSSGIPGSLAREVEEARATAEAARAAIDAGALDQARLRALGDALDAWQARLEVLERVDALDQRRADLTVWATSLRRGEATTAARNAAAQARAAGAGEGALHAYQGALDHLRDALGQPATASVHRPATTSSAVVKRTCAQGDPGCGLDGEPVF